MARAGAAAAAALLCAAPASAGVLRAREGAARPAPCTDGAGARCADLRHAAGGPNGELHLTQLAARGYSPRQLRDAAKVDPPIGNHTSYAGYFTTNETAKNHMFFWYFPAQQPPVHGGKSPLVVWLQGGPGGSSLFGALAELGPFECTSKTTIAARKYHWNIHYDMLFIDNPVGAGYSYTETDAGYATNEDEVAANLFSFIVQFYGAFPDLLARELYITGESYGGHYVPAFAYKIHEENVAASAGAVRPPLKGIAVGDGWIDPVNMIPAYRDMLYAQGLCDGQQCDKIDDYCARTVALINKGDYLGAFGVWDEMLNGDVFPYPNYFHNITGLSDYDNFMNTDEPADLAYYGAFVSQAGVRKSLHAGDRPFGGDAGTCEKHLLADFHVSMKSRLEALLDAEEGSRRKYRVLIYSGSLDVIIGTALTERFLPYVQWKGRAAYLATNRTIWRVAPGDEQVAGYVRHPGGAGGNLQVVVVRRAGHLIPHDQPRAAYDMISHFVDDTPFAA